MFELVARGEIAKLRGTEYARPFKATNLFGLARLALPKDENSALSHQTHTAHTATLADEADSCLCEFASCLHLIPNEKKKRDIFVSRYELWKALKDERKLAEAKDFLMNDPLGLQALSMRLYSSGDLRIGLFIFKT